MERNPKKICFSSSSVPREAANTLSCVYFPSLFLSLDDSSNSDNLRCSQTIVKVVYILRFFAGEG